MSMSKEELDKLNENIFEHIDEASKDVNTNQKTDFAKNIPEVPPSIEDVLEDYEEESDIKSEIKYKTPKQRKIEEVKFERDEKINGLNSIEGLYTKHGTLKEKEIEKIHKQYENQIIQIERTEMEESRKLFLASLETGSQERLKIVLDMFNPDKNVQLEFMHAMYKTGFNPNDDIFVVLSFLFFSKSYNDDLTIFKTTMAADLNRIFSNGQLQLNKLYNDISGLMNNPNNAFIKILATSEKRLEDMARQLLSSISNGENRMNVTMAENELKIKAMLEKSNNQTQAILANAERNAEKTAEILFPMLVAYLMKFLSENPDKVFKFADEYIKKNGKGFSTIIKEEPKPVAQNEVISHNEPKFSISNNVIQMLYGGGLVTLGFILSKFF